jgi:hypothetical protein
MNPDYQPDTDTHNFAAMGERRAEIREELSGKLELKIETSALAGVTENVSSIGVLFFTDGDLRVSVELEEDGVRKVKTGRLVRVQRMSLDNTGIAVEFDAE